VEDPRHPIESDHTSPTGRWDLVVAVLAVVLVLAFVFSDRTVDTAEPGAAVEPPAEPVAPPPTRLVQQTPNAPLSRANLDHEPYFIGRPGPGVPILGVDSDLAVVYVNSLGRPTVVDLDTGDVSEYEIAATRSHDQIVVEFGEIVTLDPERLNVEPAGERAIVFSVRRLTFAVARGIVERVDPGEERFSGLELCLAPARCPAQSSSDLFTEGLDSVELLSASGRADVMDLFDPRSRARDHRFLVIRSEHVDDYRVPEPLGDVIWLVHQPDDLA
jgi:hypothetical protein